jgi:hypothetical protein
LYVSVLCVGVHANGTEQTLATCQHTCVKPWQELSSQQFPEYHPFQDVHHCTFLSKTGTTSRTKLHHEFQEDRGFFTKNGIAIGAQVGFEFRTVSFCLLWIY